jgi:hypothetical protein
MKLVEKNPYRILGLLVGAKAAQFNRHRNRIPSYIDAGAELPVEFSEFSFESIGLINRTADIISEATAKLNLDGDKMIAALFWFYNGNSITDEPAFDSLKEADINQALSIWTKLTASGDVSSRNASAYSNLGTLYLSGVLEGTQTKELLFDQGISLKLKFLESDFIKDFKAIATDNTYKTTKKELQLIFLNQVQNEIEKSTVISSNKFLEILNKQSFSAKEDFMKGFVQKPIEQIEKQIQETKTKRKANKENAVSFGKVLFQKTSENLSQLKSILGSSNLKYASISDKVSDELLQCGIDYFAHYKESSTDPSSESMDLFRKAKTLGIGSIAKQRCQENTENLQEWIDDKPKRDKQKRILNDLNALLEIFKEFDNRIENILNAN